ncbi:Holin-like toxin [Bacillus manliponensis]
MDKGGICMSLILILCVMLAFLTAIFTSGYNDKPGTK